MNRIFLDISNIIINIPIKYKCNLIMPASELFHYLLLISSSSRRRLKMFNKYYQEYIAKFQTP
jgi:hypothetical protein